MADNRSANSTHDQAPGIAYPSPKKSIATDDMAELELDRAVNEIRTIDQQLAELTERRTILENIVEKMVTVLSEKLSDASDLRTRNLPLARPHSYKEHQSNY